MPHSTLTRTDGTLALAFTARCRGPFGPGAARSLSHTARSLESGCAAPEGNANIKAANRDPETVADTSSIDHEVRPQIHSLSPTLCYPAERQCGRRASDVSIEVQYQKTSNRTITSCFGPTTLHVTSNPKNAKNRKKVSSLAGN